MAFALVALLFLGRLSLLWVDKRLLGVRGSTNTAHHDGRNEIAYQLHHKILRQPCVTPFRLKAESAFKAAALSVDHTDVIEIHQNT